MAPALTRVVTARSNNTLALFSPDRLVEIRSRLVDLVDATATANAEDPAAPGWAQQLGEKGRQA